MIIEKITLNNFRSFAGEHTVDFSKYKQDKIKPVILFGGLNGSGKTSILTAIRLAILGKKSFGQSISNKVYAEELCSLTHQPPEESPLESSYVEISFKYVKQAVETHYRVRRTWINHSFKEALVIYENGFALTELSNEQAQSFLIELVPVGIADLFFFDAEKIKELAEEMDYQVLSDALKKMIGVDFVERAIVDISVLIREKNKSTATKNIRAEIEKLEDQYEQCIQKKDAEQQSLMDLYPSLIEEKKRLSTIKLRLEQEGGEWASSRDDLIKLQAELESEKRLLSSKCLELLKGSFVLGVATKFMEALTVEAQKAVQNDENRTFNKKLTAKQDELLKHLNSSSGLRSEVQGVLDSLKEPEVESRLQYVSPKSLIKLEGLKQSKHKEDLKYYLSEIERIDSELDNVGKNISRAPDHETLKLHYQKVTEKELEVTKLSELYEAHKFACKSAIQEAINLTYKLERLDCQNKNSEQETSLVNLAKRSIQAMELLTVRLTRLKVKEVESYFYESFKRMTRKEDMNLSAKIEPESFNVQLLTPKGFTIDKKRLSSGEKQIYALAMIEALGKASGRRLPLIIDTPLGRLDSKHRSNIVKEFFPKVNDQVIILSTDTEVDEAFYEALSPSISQSYELCYNDVTGRTTINDGYFWKDS